nr:exonuclease domain-containing protein [Micromonospora sp. ATCC 39149]
MSPVGLFAYGSASEREGVDLGEVPFVVVDVETTGLSSTSDRIVEIALVRIEGGRVVDEWATLVDPGRDPDPTFVHHITAEMLSGAPTFADVAGEILSRLDGAVVVAHNARFEEGFIAQEFARVGISTAPLPAVCTLRLARQVLAAPNFQLVSCCTVYGIELHDAHTALGDTRATAQLLPRHQRWCELFAAHGSTVGVSVNGPGALNRNRLDHAGRSTIQRTLRGIRILAETGLEYSVICVVTPETIDHADDLIGFFTDLPECQSVGFNIEEHTQ